MLIGSKDFGTLSYDKNTEVGIEQAKKIVRIADNVPGLGIGDK